MQPTPKQGAAEPPLPPPPKQGAAEPLSPPPTAPKQPAAELLQLALLQAAAPRSARASSHGANKVRERAPSPRPRGSCGGAAGGGSRCAAAATGEGGDHPVLLRAAAAKLRVGAVRGAGARARGDEPVFEPTALWPILARHGANSRSAGQPTKMHAAIAQSHREQRRMPPEEKGPSKL